MSDEYSSGFGAIEKVLEKQKERQSSGSGTTSRYISWKDGETKIVRFLSDSPITIGIHSWFKCPDGKSRDFVCGNELAGDKKWDCHICKQTWTDKDGNEKHFYPTKQALGLAVLREEKIEGGRIVGVTDYLHKEPQKLEVDDGKGGKVTKEFSDVPFIGIVKQSTSNFWSSLNAYYARYGTTVDRDYEIKRTGSKGGAGGTTYTIIPSDIDEKLRVKVEGENVSDVEATQKLVSETYADAMLFHPTVVEWIERMGSKARQEHWLGLSKKSGSSRETQSQETQSEEKPPAEEKNETNFSSLRESLTSYQNSVKS